MATLTPNGDAEVVVSEQGNLKYGYTAANLGATGTVTREYTVPTGKKWTLKAIYNSNGATITRVLVYLSVPAVAGLHVLYDSTTVFDFNVVLPQPITIPEGWVVTYQYSVGTDGNTVNSTLYQEFDA